ncbi:phospholipase D family protein [Rugamonas sp. A1-17]|nr:phospholipase D family protein [Rugamonas sp. A1-17]
MKKTIHTIAVALFAIATCTMAAQANTSMQSCSQYEVGFSPEGGAEEIVLKTIASARSDIKVLAYSFTSKPVVQALSQARRRGVNVSVVADASNLNSRPGTAALSALSSAGISVRTISYYKIMHDKVILVDGKTVEFGSFNYSKAAAQDNSENAQVCWNSPGIAAIYLEHWQSRWNQGTLFHPAY